MVVSSASPLSCDAAAGNEWIPEAFDQVVDTQPRIECIFEMSPQLSLDFVPAAREIETGALEHLFEQRLQFRRQGSASVGGRHASASPVTPRLVIPATRVLHCTRCRSSHARPAGVAR